MVVVVLILRSMKHEKECETKTVTTTPSSGILRPNRHNRFHLGHPSKIKQKTFEFWGDFAWKLLKYVVRKHASTLGVAMVTKGGRRQLEAQWPIAYGVGLWIKRSSVRIRPWPLCWVLGQGSILPLSQGEAFTLASVSYLAILVKYIAAKKNQILFLKISSFENSESFNSVAQGVLEIF